MSTTTIPIITIIGSLNTDLTTYVPRIPLGGETLHGSSFSTSPGGKGGNQAAACAKLSRSRDSLHNGTAVIKMVGAVGSDTFGPSLVSALTSYGIDASGVVVVKDVNTGVAVILVEETTGENRIVLSAGANATVSPGRFEDLDEPLPALVIMQLEIPLQTVLQILKVAKRKGVSVLLNPAPAVVLPEEAYSGIAHLVVNESEAMILGGHQEQELQSIDGLSTVAAGFLKRGVETVIITLGGRGVYYAGPNGVQGLVNAQKVKVVDTTAAGDTFVGAYALEVVRPDFDLRKAVEKANNAAALTVQRKGAQDSIPWIDEL